jgi:aldehyde dehydrogenase (NAD+)
VLAEFEDSSAAAVDAAVRRAAAAFEEWRAQPAAARGAALARVGDRLAAQASPLADLIVGEVGKPIREARGEVARAVAICRYYAQLVLAPDGETYPAADPAAWLVTRRFPRGVCGLITPWNFPLAIPLWKAAPALVYGNAVVLKPAPQGTAVAQAVEELLAMELPDAVFALVTGDNTPGRALVGHNDVAAVSFTGSIPVGRQVAATAAGRGATVQCELGGQNPSIVLADADLDRAAATIAQASMGYAGQKCTATSRVIVEGPVYAELRDRLVAAIESMGLFDPANESCEIGPLIDEGARTRALEALRATDGRTLTGGAAPGRDGWYLAPTLVEVDDARDVLAQEEVFAPVAALLRAPSVDAAVELANGVRHGLVAAVFTSQLERTLGLATRLEAGLVRANAATSGVDFHAPFGGSKASSIGPREQGLAARDFYTESRTFLLAP